MRINFYRSPARQPLRVLSAITLAIVLTLLGSAGPVAASVTNGLANQVIGQTGADGLPDFSKGAGTLSGTTNAGSPDVSNRGFGNIIGQQMQYSKPVIDEVAHRLYVADAGNNRIVFYNLTSGNVLADAVQDGVIGQDSLFRSDLNRGNLIPSANSLLGPNSISVSGQYLWVADTKNNRVLRFNTVTGNGSDQADMVLGQSDFITTSANRGGSTAANSLNTPTDVLAVTGGVWIVDNANHRVVFYANPVGDGSDAASKVIGQTNLTSGTSGLAAGRFNTPVGMTVIGTDVWVSERVNQRVLRFSNPVGDGTDTASAVLGQANFTTSNRTRPAQNAFNAPAYLTADTTGSRLYVSEYSGNRITGWDLPPSGDGSGESADVLIGQTGYTGAVNGGGASNSSVPTTAGGLSFPNGLSWAPSTNTLYAFDSGNARVTQYDSPTGIVSAANRQVGQVDFTTHFTNGSGTSLSTLQGGLAVDRTRHLLYVGDTSNQRVLVYQLTAGNLLADSNPDGVIGQPNLQSNNRNRGGTTAANSLGAPSGMVVDADSNLWVVDNLNSRVLRFPVPDGNGTDAADKVIGQANLISGGLNRGGTPAANSLRNPVALTFKGTALWVADFGNNRLLRFPTQTGDGSDAADMVIGQAGFTTNSANRGGSVAQNSLNLPESIVFDASGRMWITDALNHRVLRYSATPTGDGTDAAEMVIGQANYTSNTANRGSSVAANTLNNPTIAGIDAAGALWVEDEANSRLLRYTNPVGDGTDTADKVIGQADYVSGGQNRGQNQAGADRLSIPYGLLIEPEGFWVGERLNHRVLFYNLGPSVPGQPTATSPTTDTTPTFTWTASTDTDHYEVEWSTDSTFASGVVTGTSVSATCTLSTTACGGPTGLTAGTWYVRVRAVDTAGLQSAYSASGQVVIQAVASPSPSPTVAPTAAPTTNPNSGTAAGTAGSAGTSTQASFDRLPKSGQIGLILLATFVATSLLYYGRRARRIAKQNG